MDGLSGWVYPLAFLASAVLALVLTPLALRAAVRFEVLDEPGGHKAHESPTPYLGGVAIAVAFSVAILAAVLLRPPPSGVPALATLLGCAVALSVVGLVDDLRGLSVKVRFAAQIAAGVALWWVGSGVALSPSEPVNALITVVWVVGITNAFNLLDNMDGLSAGVAAIAAASFFVIASLEGQFLVAALSIALAGCSLGFLRHNFPPARIYMGDAGSLFLGFLLAAIGIRLRFDAPMQVTFLVPVIVLGVAIFDTTLVTITRIAHGRSPFTGGRDHVSHRLVFVGVPVHAAVSLIYGGAVGLGWLAVIMSRVDVATGMLLAGFIAAVALFLGVMLGAVPVYENSRRRRFMLRVAADHEVGGGPPGDAQPSPPVDEERPDRAAPDRSAPTGLSGR